MISIKHAKPDMGSTGGDQSSVIGSKTLHEVIGEFRETMPFSGGTKAYKSRFLREMQRNTSPTVKVADVRRSDMLRYIAKYEHLAPGTVNHMLTAARQVFRHAISDRIIDASPMDGIKHRIPKSTIKRLVPTYDEFTAIVESIRSQRFADTAEESADLIQFMGQAGLGQAECAGLRWQDINFQSGPMSRIRQKTGVEFIIPISPLVEGLLKKLSAAPHSPSESVFKVRNPKKSLLAACRRLNLPEYSARAFRRMFITRCLEKGIDAQTIASWQGHQDGGALILKVYARVSQKHQDEMAARLG